MYSCWRLGIVHDTARGSSRGGQAPSLSAAETISTLSGRWERGVFWSCLKLMVLLPASRCSTNGCRLQAHYVRPTTLSDIRARLRLLAPSQRL